MEWLKALLCVGAALWLHLDRREEVVPARTWRRIRRPALLLMVLAAVGGVGGWALAARQGLNGKVHLWDVYHYYMGAKYFPELSYQGLYDCSLAADLEAGQGGDLSRRYMRDLSSNKIQRASLALSRSISCRQRFEPGRWASFAADVAWFRGQVPRGRWHDVFKDHGFNGTPVWIIIGRLLSSTGAASAGQIFFLATLDFALFGVMWLLVLRAFGGRAALAAGAFWLGNFPARLNWTAGSFLRQPWLFCSVGGICMLHQGQDLWAGAALGTAALLRIFPAALLFGPLLNMGRSLVGSRRPRLALPQRRFLLGLVLAVALLVPASFVAGGGPGAWPAWAANMGTHLTTPSTNLMGLKVVASYTHGTRSSRLHGGGGPDPYAAWRAARQAVFKERRPGFVALVGVFLLLLARAVWGRTAWQSATLSVGLIPVASAPSCYYYSILLCYGLLVRRWRGVAAGLNLYAALGWIIVTIWPIHDEQYTWLSALSVLYVVAVTARAALGADRERP